MLASLVRPSYSVWDSGGAGRLTPLGLIEFIIVATVLGLAVYLITTYVPMPQPVRTIIIVAVVLVLVLILLRGLLGDISLPRLRM